MSLYRFADITVRLSALSPAARQFLDSCRVDADRADEDLSPTAADLQKEAAFAPDAPLYVLEITAVLRKMAAVLCARYDGCLLHAAVIVFNGKAYTFVAPSGTGKTTHCRLWLDVLGDRARILNGDKPFVRRLGDRFVAYGNPWNGKEGYGEAGCYPLSGIFLLHRAPDNAVRPVSDTDALAALMGAVAVTKDADARLKTVGLLDALVRTVPVYDLFVNMQPEAVRTALSALEESI